MKPDIEISEGQRKIMQQLVANYIDGLATLEEYSRQIAEGMGFDLAEYSFDIARMKFIDKASLNGKGGG